MGFCLLSKLYLVCFGRFGFLIFNLSIFWRFLNGRGVCVMGVIRSKCKCF